jgi:hypothetical protein
MLISYFIRARQTIPKTRCEAGQIKRWYTIILICSKLPRGNLICALKAISLDVLFSKFGIVHGCRRYFTQTLKSIYFHQMAAAAGTPALENRLGQLLIYNCIFYRFITFAVQKVILWNPLLQLKPPSDLKSLHRR